MEGLNESHVNSYYKYMVDIASVLGADKEKAKKELKEVVEFEIELAKVPYLIFVYFSVLMFNISQ